MRIVVMKSEIGVGGWKGERRRRRGRVVAEENKQLEVKRTFYVHMPYLDDSITVQHPLTAQCALL